MINKIFYIDGPAGSGRFHRIIQLVKVVEKIVQRVGFQIKVNGIIVKILTVDAIDDVLYDSVVLLF